jgi:glycosyltransferase involved in cell wall biosynthesis
MLNIYGAINTLGYGIHACNMIKALIENGEEIALASVGQVAVDPFFEMYLKEASKKKLDENVPSVFIFHDEYCGQAKGNPLFVFSIFETSKPKDESIEALKFNAKEILTTTQRHKDILSTLIIDKPIHVVNEGIDDCLYNTIPVDKYIDTKKFTYITVGKRELRKNTDIILKNFINEMKEKEVALISHTFNPFINKTNDHPFKNLNCWSGINPLKHGFEYKGFTGKAHKFTYKQCDIYFTLPTIPVSMMPSLYHSANLGIQASRGEGWDLPMTEMMACGVPVIATSCLGHDEYLIHPELPEIQEDLIIKSKGSEVAIDNVWFHGSQGEWDILDVDEFNALLRATHNNSYYSNKSDTLADFISENYAWNRSAQDLLKVISECK